MVIAMIMIMASAATVNAQTTKTEFPIEAGSDAFELEINPNDFLHDQAFDLRSVFNDVKEFKGEDMCIFVIVEGYSFLLKYNGDKETGRQMLKQVLAKSKVMVVAKQKFYNVVQGSSGFILYPASEPDPEFPDISDIQLKPQR